MEGKPFLANNSKGLVIPPKARVTHKGPIFTSYSWQQELSGGQQAEFEALERSPTVNAIAVFEGKVVVTKEIQPVKGEFISIPGGRVEAGESPVIAAARELLEETGLKAGSMDLFCIDNPQAKIAWQVYTFVARNCRKASKPHLDAGEQIEVQFYCWEDFIELLIHNDQIRLGRLNLEAARAKLSSNLNSWKEFVFGR